MADDKIRRWIAVKTDINALFNLEFFEGDSDLPSYILTKKNKKIYRINLMAIVLDFNKTGNITNVLIDDGSGKINLRFFEDNKILYNISIGNSLLIIGRLRIYNNEKYLSPEIVKLINPLWLKVRALELEKKNDNSEDKISNNKEINEKNIEQNKQKYIIQENTKKEHKVEEIVDEETESEHSENVELLPSEKVIQLIKDLDKGNGVLIEDIIDKSNIKEAEQIINIMIKNGEIFQNMPGKVKVL